MPCVFARTKRRRLEPLTSTVPCSPAAVHAQTSIVLEGHAAVFAAVRLLASVDAHVDLEVRVAAQHLAAHAAHGGLDVGEDVAAVEAALVLEECGLVAVHCSTLVALDATLVRLVTALHVTQEVEHARRRELTLVALVHAHAFNGMSVQQVLEHGVELCIDTVAQVAAIWRSLVVAFK